MNCLALDDGKLIPVSRIVMTNDDDNCLRTEHETTSTVQSKSSICPRNSNSASSNLIFEGGPNFRNNCHGSPNIKQGTQNPEIRKTQLNIPKSEAMKFQNSKQNGQYGQLISFRRKWGGSERK